LGASKGVGGERRGSGGARGRARPQGRSVWSGWGFGGLAGSSSTTRTRMTGGSQEGRELGRPLRAAGATAAGTRGEAARGSAAPFAVGRGPGSSSAISVPSAASIIVAMPFSADPAAAGKKSSAEPVSGRLWLGVERQRAGGRRPAPAHPSVVLEEARAVSRQRNARLTLKNVYADTRGIVTVVDSSATSRPKWARETNYPSPSLSPYLRGEKVHRSTQQSQRELEASSVDPPANPRPSTNPPGVGGLPL